jgi:putative addiction module killer protein
MVRELVYLNRVEKWLDSLTKLQLKSLAKEIKLLELCGQDLRLPHSRVLGAGLFELRERRYGLRIYYGFEVDQRIILLHAGHKDDQTKDFSQARRLLEKYRNRYES